MVAKESRKSATPFCAASQPTTHEQRTTNNEPRTVAIDKTSKIYIAGHRGMVGSAIVRRLQQGGYTHLITRTRQELDLLEQRAVFDFLDAEKPEYIFMAAARVGGIHANNTYRADFIYENLTVQANMIHGAHLALSLIHISEPT